MKANLTFEAPAWLFVQAPQLHVPEHPLPQGTYIRFVSLAVY